MELNVITIDQDTPVVFKFNLRGEFEEKQLKAFDYISVKIGNEIYTTYSYPEHFFIDPQDSKRLVLRVGVKTRLSEGSYFATIKGYNVTYENGYELNSRARPLLRPVEVRKI